MLDDLYVRQASLLLRCLPLIDRQTCFALKGGTAINLFCRDMPRLSVDIDLTYLPLSPRDAALAHITQALSAIAEDIDSGLGGIQVHPAKTANTVTGLLISHEGIQVKIEVNPVLRGSVFPPSMRDLSPGAQTFFQQFVAMRTLSMEDLYGGKICAALDRQHPRDLYDVRLLLDTEGLLPKIRRAFVVYLASHDRPMSELLSPRPKDIAVTYRNAFVGMSREDIPLEQLLETRDQLIALVREGLDADEKRFLLSLKQGEPDWGALGIPHLHALPALQWKLKNIHRMAKGKRREALARLREALGT